MKIKVTYIGTPMEVTKGDTGFNVVLEFEGRHTSAFVRLADNLKQALYNAANEEIARQKRFEQLAAYAGGLEALVGKEIEVP